MPVPDYQTLMRSVLALAANGDVSVGEAAEAIADQLGLDPADRAAMVPSGRSSLLRTRIHWAKTYLAKAGLLDSPRRGVIRITPRGAAILASHPDRIDNSVLRQFPEFRGFVDAAPASGPATEVEPAPQVEETPVEIMRAAHRQIEAALAEELLARIAAAPPAFFERLIVHLLERMGYGGAAADAARVLGRSGDDGVDGVIDQDALGLDRVYVQAKRYASGNTIGAGPIRDFFGSLDRHKAAKGLFVTTSAFTAQARETAEYLSKRIVLIDGERLAQLMIHYDVGCRVVETLSIRRLDEDFFE